MPRNNPYANVPAAPADLDLEAYASGRPLELEVGFGRGHFIMDRGAQQPETRHLGLEVRRKWVALAAQRAVDRGLNNVELLYGNVHELLPTWQPEGYLSSVFINFPDPWWKKRHRKRLVVAPDMLAHYARLLRPGGLLFLQTDVAERAELYEALLRQEPGLRQRLDSTGAPLTENPLGVMSHREKKCAQTGLSVYRFVFEKVSQPELLQDESVWAEIVHTL
jgi:tRNA (guanine-N7-)-methyltransferase